METKLIYGDFKLALRKLDIHVAIGLSTDISPLWGLSRLLVSDTPENEILKSKSPGTYTFRNEGERRIINLRVDVADMSVPYRRMVGLEEGVKDILSKSAFHGYKNILIQYPGLGLCGQDIHGFIALIKEISKDYKGIIYITVANTVAEKLEDVLYIGDDDTYRNAPARVVHPSL